MNCPKCGKEMVKREWRITHGGPEDKEYDHTLYLCKADDIWVTTEIPK